MRDSIFVIFGFAIFSYVLWLLISVRGLSILKNRARKQREYVKKLLRKRQSLVPLLVVAIEKITVIDEGLKRELLLAREASMELKGLDQEKVFTEKINEVTELALNHSEIKKSGYFLEISTELKKNFDASKSAILVLEKDVNEINGKMKNKIFLVSGFLAGINDFDKRVL
ncbi:MAG: hypothetical protein RBS56_04890 [Candidatus Gracilibacteria bacterium]|jgi:hypothetical protein|nr:hypothetical protein [Candidatus Gracilibacteria bacterium]